MIQIDRDQTRQYAKDGQRYFSVSQVCAVITGEQGHGSDADLQRGTDLHMIFALAVASFAGRCAPPVVPMEYQGYYQSMCRWIDRWKPAPILIERPSISSVKGMPFAGTPDLLALLPAWHRAVLIDLKSGQPAPWHRVQVQAYHKLIDYKQASKLCLLYIHPDGSEPAFLDVKKNPRDMAAFASALNLLTYREGL